MTKEITVSDDVYRQLERAKGDRAISEVIADHLESGRSLQDVTGQGIFTAESSREIKDEIRAMTHISVEPFDEWGSSTDP